MRPGLPLDIETSDHGPVRLLRIHGEVDIATSPSLRNQLREVLDDPPAALVIDLGEVPFLDSTGLGVLIAAYKRAAAIDVPLCLARPRRIVANALTLVRIDTVIPVHHTVEDAITASGGAPPADPPDTIDIR